MPETLKEPVTLHLHVGYFPVTNIIEFQVSANNVNPYASIHVLVFEEEFTVPEADSFTTSDGDGKLTARLSKHASLFYTETTTYYATIYMQCTGDDYDAYVPYSSVDYTAFEYNYTDQKLSSKGTENKAITSTSRFIAEKGKTSPQPFLYGLLVATLVSVCVITCVVLYAFHRRRHVKYGSSEPLTERPLSSGHVKGMCQSEPVSSPHHGDTLLPPQDSLSDTLYSEKKENERKNNEEENLLSQRHSSDHGENQQSKDFEIKTIIKTYGDSLSQSKESLHKTSELNSSPGNKYECMKTSGLTDSNQSTGSIIKNKDLNTGDSSNRSNDYFINTKRDSPMQYKDRCMKNNGLTYGDSGRCADYLIKTSGLTSGDSSRRPVMVLFHPDSPRHTMKVQGLCKFLECHGTNVQGFNSNYIFNWRDYADIAGDVCKEIVIVLSESLCELCSLYPNRGCFDSTNHQRWNQLLSERLGEYVPCIVLDNLKHIYQDRDDTFAVHLVIFDREDYRLIDLFLNMNGSFLTNENTFIFCLLSQHLSNNPTSVNYPENIWQSV